MFISPPFLLLSAAFSSCTLCLAFRAFSSVAENQASRERYIRLAGKGRRGKKLDYPLRSSQGLKDLHRHIPICPRLEFQNFDPGVWVLAFQFPDYPISQLPDLGRGYPSPPD